MMLPIRRRSLLSHSVLKRSVLKRSLALLLASVMLCPPADSLLLAAQAQAVPPAPPMAPAPPSGPPPGAGIRIPTAPPSEGVIRTILLFPFANNLSASSASTGYDPVVIGARIEDAVKMRLNVLGRFKADSFSPRLPQIQRALTEARVEGLTENDLTPPYNDRQRGEKIAMQVGTDGYLLGSIDVLSTDPASRNVALTVSATLYNSATGHSVKSVAATGHGVSYSPTDDPDNLLQSAINDAAGHLVASLNDSASRQPVGLSPNDTVRGHRNNNGSVLLGLLLAVGIGLAISSASHGGGSGSSSSGTTSGTSTTTTGSSGNSSLPPSPPNP